MIRNKTLRLVAAGAVLLGIGQFASATSCSSVISSYNSCGSSTSCQAQYVSQHPECFGGGSAATSAQINSTTVFVVSTVSNVIGNRLLGATPPVSPQKTGMAEQGIAAGGQPGAWNVWGNVSNNDTKLSYTNQAGTNTRTETDILNTVLGLDYTMSPSVILGVSASFDKGSGSGQTNNGAVNSISTKGYSIAPYLGYQLSKDWALDASVGMGDGRVTSAGTSTTESDRVFAAANATYNQWFGNTQVAGKIGYLHAEEDAADTKNSGAAVANTANKSKLDQLRLGIQAGYWMNGFMPYAGMTYTSDHRSVSNAATKAAGDPIGKNAFLWTVGANFFSLGSKVTGGIAYNQETGRTNSKNNSLTANINFRF